MLGFQHDAPVLPELAEGVERGGTLTVKNVSDILKVRNSDWVKAMTAIRVKDKAQITLPARIRKALGIKEGDYLNVSMEDGKVVLTPQVMLDRLPEGKLSAEG